MMQELVFGILLTWFGFWPAESAAAGANGMVSCGGALSQGGLIVCMAPEGSRLSYGDHTMDVGADGLAVFGVAQDAEPEALVTGDVLGLGVSISLPLSERDDPFRVISGLDCDKVDARTPEQKAHAGESWVAKQAAFAQFHVGRDWVLGFDRPSDGPPSSPFGPQRKYIGVSAVTGERCEKFSIHRGYDIATPVGTPLRAPAGGTVSLADPDLYYEGGTIFLDHGHGLVSVFMHLSTIDVALGDRVERGEQIARTGNTGRTTGPHLHWAVKWRHAASEDREADFYIDPALLMDADFGFVAANRPESSGTPAP